MIQTFQSFPNEYGIGSYVSLTFGAKNVHSFCRSNNVPVGTSCSLRIINLWSLGSQLFVEKLKND